MIDRDTVYRLRCDEPWHTEPEYDDGDEPHYIECMKPVEPVGTFAVRHDWTEDERYMLSVHFEPMRSGGLIIWTDLPPGDYWIVPIVKADDE